MEAHYNVLFLCTGNSARSILAEAILKHKGKPVVTAYSAESHPSGTVHPEALKQLELAAISTIGLRSKSWDEFSRPGAPEMQFVFTVCDNAAQEICPAWPGHPHDRALGSTRSGCRSWRLLRNRTRLPPSVFYS
jgi:arsenate reductase